jgi:hypothetical protein
MLVRVQPVPERDARTRYARARGPALACMALLLAIAVASPCPASSARIYRYSVKHPIYGDIGSYTNHIEGPDSDARVESELHIAVRILGVIVYREDAVRTEQWRAGRMTFFDGLTVTNGRAIHVSGTAKGAHFAITSPEGSALAPADVKPSNPWSLSMLRDGAMMSTKTGRLFQAHVIVGPTEPFSKSGDGPPARRYDVISDKREPVWFDERGVAVAFGTVSGDARIMFVLAGG